MFSWSSASRSTPPAPGYPGTRTANNNSSSPLVAQPISGSIRPPEYTRAQHIESYLNDDTLKRSTRRVSAGTSKVYGREKSFFDTTWIIFFAHLYYYLCCGLHCTALNCTLLIA